MRRLVPRSLLGQLALLILAAFIAAQAISLWLFADARGAAVRAAQRFEAAERTAAVLHALDTAPVTSRASILAAANSRLVRFSLTDMPLIAADTDMSPAALSAISPALRRQLVVIVGADRDPRISEIAISPHDDGPADPPMAVAWLHERMRAAGVAPVMFRLSARLDDGGWLNMSARLRRPDIRLPPAIVGTMLVSLALIMAALWLGLRRIVNPLRRLAVAADGFGLDGPAPEMPRTGPQEVRALSEALARMQARLSSMIADRTRMLAALGHDLRSPITALRLRADMVEDDETRARMTAILDEMQDMVEATLAFARGVSTDQPTEAADLTALLTDLARELSETGPSITVDAAGPISADIRRTPMRRALRNLLENAQRYGGGAKVTLRKTGGVDILIDDTGPGIPPDDLDHVFDPFRRLETSRSPETGGIGLGLPIARAIFRAHGGDVRLSNRPEGGLRVTATLPEPLRENQPDGSV